MKSIDMKKFEGDEEEEEAGALLAGNKWKEKSKTNYMNASFARKRRKIN